MKDNQQHASSVKWSFQVNIDFTDQQDHFLRELRQNKKLKSWKMIAMKINEQYDQVVRSGKQCRQRYLNHARFCQKTQKTIDWSSQQDENLFKLFMDYGPRWVLISKQMPNKSQNSLKNRFYNAIGKMTRKMKKIEVQKKLKNKKTISSQSLINVFRKLGLILKQKQEMKHSRVQQNCHYLFLHTLERRLIKSATQGLSETSQEEIFCLILDIHKFNMITRASKDQKNSNESADCFSMLRENYIFATQQIPMTKNFFGKNIQKAQKSKPPQLKKHGKPSDNQQIQLCQFFSELSQDKNNFKQNKTLQQELCIILNEQYAPENFSLLQ